MAFSQLEARPVEVEVQLASVSRAWSSSAWDKAASEARARERAAFALISRAIPAGRMIVTLAPADLPKEGSHHDAPIALAMIAAIGALPRDALDGVLCLGELSLNGALAPAPGA